VNFAEQPPSKQWAALKYRGKQFAEVWLKPADEPFALIIRVPRASFGRPGVGPLLTAENLLRAVGLTAAEVESWRHEGAADGSAGGSDPELGQPLSPPVEGAGHLSVHVQLKPPVQGAAATEAGQTEIPETRWQDLEAHWNHILGLEASIDMLRISMEALRGELEGSSRRTLSTEEKLHALNADVLLWSKAKVRIIHALPKMREFIHRATWAAGAPERKKLDELFKNYIHPRIAFPEMNRVVDQLDNLLKDRQVLSAQGVKVYQDCKTIAADVQGALQTLLANSVANATKKRGAALHRSKSLRL
jgi:hypothetical protein